MTVLIFLLHALPGSFLIACPEPTNDWIQEWYNTTNNAAFKMWTSKTGDRIQLASISSLLIGPVTFVLSICLILFEERWVAKIVAKCRGRYSGNDPMNRMYNNPREDANEMMKIKIEHKCL